MTGIKALDRLHAYEDVDRFEAMELWDIAHIADAIEREIAERYMLLGAGMERMRRDSRCGEGNRQADWK